MHPTPEATKQSQVQCQHASVKVATRFSVLAVNGPASVFVEFGCGRTGVGSDAMPAFLQNCRPSAGSFRTSKGSRKPIGTSSPGKLTNYAHGLGCDGAKDLLIQQSAAAIRESKWAPKWALNEVSRIGANSDRVGLNSIWNPANCSRKSGVFGPIRPSPPAFARAQRGAKAARHSSIERRRAGTRGKATAGRPATIIVPSRSDLFGTNEPSTTRQRPMGAAEKIWNRHQNGHQRSTFRI